MTRPDNQTDHSLSHPAEQLLAGLRPGDRRELSLLKRRISFKPGDYIVKAGEKPDMIFVHRCGAFRTIEPRGSVGCIHQEPESDLVYGLFETLSGSGFDFSIRSISMVEFDVIEKDDLLNFMRARPDLVRRLTADLSSLYEQALRKLRNQ